ncbi:hypothetical protein CCM_05315 [Cordyceps militaris CM01]|uniref:Cytochrome oxidase c assembly domain-containing protein n=2 Tax=Cordyceps militaris TaxID=73501 RepID=G3JJ10_CORMM|nr:uncharacterized protein CCM_05315 [Cordyceps militaris CM01]ATY58559.1 hypothetical protein A9K55_002681 [Cordyceps militaris]EGX91157.1 hypothetical protein CCM_05315 [Cordyceps militaris CM01]
MASRIGPRTVKDATRFTSTIPHATSKTATSATSPSIAASTPRPSRVPGETPEQRVKRLRLAHLAAQKAQVSQTDRLIDASRRFLDVAHRWTVGGIVVFTAVAGVISVYSVWDMLRYNRARRAEWVEAQKKLESDELASARLAYLKGAATEEQIALVEAANREAEEKGIRLPPLIAPPEHRTHFEEHLKPTLQGDDKAAPDATGKGVLGIFSGLFGGASKEAPAAAPPSQPVQAVESAAQSVWDRELENQRKGGSLDQLGLAGASGEQGAKKGWWPW